MHLSELPDELEAFARKIGYTDAWMAAGVINEQLLEKQWKVYQESDDHNGEHYRHGAFVYFVRNREEFTDEEVHELLSLHDNADDVDLTENRLFEMIRWLPLEQSLSLRTRHADLFSKSAEKFYNRHVAYRRIQMEGVPAVFDDVKHLADGTLERDIVEHPTVEREQLDWLQEHGTGKKIRNMAKALLNSRRFRNTKP